MDTIDNLPLGTVVKLKQYINQEQEINHMIIGSDCINSQTNEEFKYLLVVYPYGLATDNIWYANESDIYKILFIPNIQKKCYNKEVDNA